MIVEQRMDKIVKLVNILKDDRYLFCKEGVYFSLDKKQMKELLVLLKENISGD
jgi:hypothetical protein